MSTTIAATKRLSDTLGSDFDLSAGGIYLPGATTESLSHLTEFERSVFAKKTRRLLEVTDVGDNPTDFDAQETILNRHLRLNQDRVYSTGSDPRVLRYAADLTTDLPALSEEVLVRAVKEARQNKRNLPQDVVEALQLLDSTTLRILLNSAPRNQAVDLGRNGRDFHLGLTTDGTEIYACPVESFAYIRHKLSSLFRVPTDGHPLTEDGEQFRSSLFGQTAHLAPEHLEVLWRRGEASESALNSHIPEIRQEEVAFIDEPFRNRRVFSPDIHKFMEELDANVQNSDRTVRIRIGESEVRAYLVKSLAEIPGGHWGVYANVADAKHNGNGYFELNKRLQDGASIEDPEQRSDMDLKPHDQELGKTVHILPKQ